MVKHPDPFSFDLPKKNGSIAARLPERFLLGKALYPLNAPPPKAMIDETEVPGLSSSSSNAANAAVLVGLVPRAQHTQVLLTRRTDTLRHHAGQVSFPGGRAEPEDDNVVETAIRESHEEIGLFRQQIEPLGYLDSLITISGFHVFPVVAAIDPGYVAQPDPIEVAEVFEVPLAFLKIPENLRHVVLNHRGQRRTVLEYAWPEQRIWGATAAILDNLCTRLEHQP